MSDAIYILFCESPFQYNKVDEDYIEEYNNALACGFKTLLFSFEDLTSSDRQSLATKKIKAIDDLSSVIYRGWMLTPAQYSILYSDLLSKNYKLINTVQEYQNCHYLPDSLKFIENSTPKTVFEKYFDSKSIELLIEKSKTFGNRPVIIKDYVKSEKHDWETACYIKDASNTDNLRNSINNLISLRDKYLNEGIVVREYVDLNELTIHSKSGMPLTEEYRLFFLNNKLLGIFDYWEEGDYIHPKPITSKFEEIAQKIDSNFFCMDIARLKNDELIIIELGDGQVAGLPDKTNIYEFYKTLTKQLKNS